MRSLLFACALGLLAPPSAVDGSVDVYTLDVPHIVTAGFTDLPAAFGARLPDDGLRGLLVLAAPRDGCDKLALPPDAESDKWIVLIARYNCSFETKIRHAQEAGFVCAIVHNVNSSEIDTMTTKHPAGIEIPSVFVSSAAGDSLGEKYLYSKGSFKYVMTFVASNVNYTVNVSENELRKIMIKLHFSYYIIVTGTPFDINTQLLLPFAIVVAICLFIMIGLMIVKCVRDRRHARRRRLPSRALKKIPTCKFSKGDPYDTCAICLDDYVEGERLRVLPCAHAYHCACIDPWLTQSRRVCPVCKRRVLAAGERRRAPSDTDSDDSRAPLASAASPASPARPTQGGTFEPQRENPFVRAARFVRRQRRASSETVQHRDEENNSTSVDEETGQHDESQPLILPAEAPAPQRRLRLFWPRRSPAPPAASPAPPAPPPPPPPAALLPHSAEHSINTEARGEIGVAALPASPNPPPQIIL